MPALYRHIIGEFSMDDSKRLCVHMLDKAISYLPTGPGSGGAAAAEPGALPGARGEQLVGIIDLRGFSVPQNADFTFAAFMVEAFFVHYPKRVGQVLLVDAPWVFAPAWEVIRPLMRKYAALVRFVSSEQLRKEFFAPDDVPAEFR